MPKIDPGSAPLRIGSNYPAPFDTPCRLRERQSLTADGLEQFGVNRLRLPPGAWSSQRHWHSAEDEFVYVLEGEAVLVDDTGEHVLRPGDSALFKAGDPNGHQIQNRGTADVMLLEVGGRSWEDVTTYADIDMRIDAREDVYRRKDGTAY